MGITSLFLAETLHTLRGSHDQCVLSHSQRRLEVDFELEALGDQNV